MLLPPPPPQLTNLPRLDGHRLKAYGTTWHIEMLALWRADLGLFPDLDILCRLTTESGRRIHSILVETDRLFLHLPRSNDAIVRAIERALVDRWMPLFVRIDAVAP